MALRALRVEARGDKPEATFDDVLLSVSIPLAEEGTSESIKVEVKES